MRRERERGIPAERIVVAGFSQGGAMALFLGPRWPERLGGVMALSTYLPLSDTLAKEAHPANAAVPRSSRRTAASTPWCRWRLGEKSRERLRALGYDVDWRSYPMPHSLCAQEVEDLREFLLRALPPRA